MANEYVTDGHHRWPVCILLMVTIDGPVSVSLMVTTDGQLVGLCGETKQEVRLREAG